MGLLWGLEVSYIKHRSTCSNNQCSLKWKPYIIMIYNWNFNGVYIIQFAFYKYNSGFCPSPSCLPLTASSLPQSFFIPFQPSISYTFVWQNSVVIVFKFVFKTYDLRISDATLKDISKYFPKQRQLSPKKNFGAREINFSPASDM